MSAEPRWARTPAEWNTRYLADDAPWDVGRPSPFLIEQVNALAGTVNRALDLGCGTGSDALWLASQGTSVVAVDVAPRALEVARAKVARAGLEHLVSFVEFDALQSPPVENATVELVFDRGMFHSVAAEQRSVVARRVCDALKPGGRWLTLIGNADESSIGKGPRRLTAQDVVGAIEPLFRVMSLRAGRMDVRDGSPLIWEGVFEPRSA